MPAVRQHVHHKQVDLKIVTCDGREEAVPIDIPYGRGSRKAAACCGLKKAGEVVMPRAAGYSPLRGLLQ